MFREYAPLRGSALRSVTGVRVAPVSPPARVTFHSPIIAQTFAEIEAALGH